MLKIIIYIFFVLFSIILVLVFQRKRIELKQYKELRLIFKDHNITLPTLKFGSSYQWPTFTVIFANQADYEYAEQNKLCELFDRRIESFYDSEFKADMAIFYKYPGMKIHVGGNDIEV